MLTTLKANPGYKTSLQGPLVAAPHPSKGLPTRVTLSGFCRAKEKKHSFHVATPRKDFQFHSEVTCGTHATCGPWAQGCRRLTPGLVCGGLLQEGGQVCSVPCIADAAKSSEDAARGSRQAGKASWGSLSSGDMRSLPGTGNSVRKGIEGRWLQRERGLLIRGDVAGRRDGGRVRVHP